MKLHVKADSVTPASLTRLCILNGLTDGMAPRFKIQLRLAQAKLCLEQRPGLSQAFTKVHGL
jgi:hypothetical protein